MNFDKIKENQGFFLEHNIGKMLDVDLHMNNLYNRKHVCNLFKFASKSQENFYEFVKALLNNNRVIVSGDNRSGYDINKDLIDIAIEDALDEVNESIDDIVLDDDTLVNEIIGDLTDRINRLKRISIG